MRKINFNLLYVYGFVIIVIAVLAFSWYQHHEQGSATPVVVTASTIPKATVDEDAVALEKISSNCAKYYDTFGQGPDPIDNELADFTNLHPLSDFLCGDYSMIQPKVKLPDGKILHFVAPVFSIDCGASGYCTYYPLLEEKPGLVRHIRGFTSYGDDSSVSQDTDGTIFAWEITYDSSNNTLLVDDTHL
jgi:hypothetical protein